MKTKERHNKVLNQRHRQHHCRPIQMQCIKHQIQISINSQILMKMAFVFNPKVRFGNLRKVFLFENWKKNFFQFAALINEWCFLGAFRWILFRYGQRFGSWWTWAKDSRGNQAVEQWVGAHFGKCGWATGHRWKSVIIAPWWSTFGNSSELGFCVFNLLLYVYEDNIKRIEWFIHHDCPTWSDHLWYGCILFIANYSFVLFFIVFYHM